MKFRSTNGPSPKVSFMEAAKNGLAPDGGLYLPAEVPIRNNLFWESLHKLSFADIAFEMARPFLKGELSDPDLRKITNDAFNFPVKMVELNQQEYVLELFHGPTLAFKDFGARFMARIFSRIAQDSDQEITILTATSGDTGSAVAQGFYDVPGVRVCLLFPKGNVSPFQKKQMTTLGKNIIALEVDGVFDDCQDLVKRAFMDEELNQTIQLSSANSINIARLLPQSFYYAFALGELQKRGLSVPVFSVPSGNFGNLTGGLFSMKMGMPAHQFLAATNSNDVVPVYLKGGDFVPAKSVQTISNAMDVGNPSNFARILSMFDGSRDQIGKSIKGFSYSDDETRETILQTYQEYGYIACPHTAIGLRAAREYLNETAERRPVVTLATAHPIKFREVIEPVIGKKLEETEQIHQLAEKESLSLPMRANYSDFKEFLLKKEAI